MSEEKIRHYVSEHDFVKDLSKDPSNQQVYDNYKAWLRAEIEKMKEANDYLDSVWGAYHQKLAFLEAQDAGDLVRMHQIASECNPNWLAVVSRPEITNCGRFDPEEQKRDEKWWEYAQSVHREETLEEWQKNHPSFRMDFVCTKKWNEMSPTENRKVRFCGDCQKNVYFCDNIIEARELGQQGCCIGIDVGVQRREHDLVGELAIFGRPTAEHKEENKQQGLPDRISSKRIMKKAEYNMRGKHVPDPTSVTDDYEDTLF